MRLLAVCLLFVACTGSGRKTFGPEHRVRKGNVFYFGVGAEPESIDPGLCYDSPGFEISRNLFEGLTRQDPRTLRAQPGLASSWDRAPDGLRWVFHLRPAVWSDGSKVTAGDFVYSWLRVLDPASGAQYAPLLWSLKNGKAYAEGKTPAQAVGVRALDDSTLEVELDHPVPWLLDLLAFGPFCPVPRSAVEKWGIHWTRPEHIVTSGPFLLTGWRINYEIDMTRNPAYWDASGVSLDGAVGIVSDDNDAQLRLFRAGSLDWLGSDPRPPHAYLSMLRTKSDFISDPELTTYFYWLNLRRGPPLDDVRVRQALSLAIDRDALVKYVLGGGERPARSVVPDTMRDVGYVAPQGPPDDPVKARALLAEAGYGPGGKPFPRLEMIFNTNDEHKQVAEALQQMWKKELGIDVELVNQEWKVFMNNRNEGYFQIARAGWQGDFLDPYSFLVQFLTDSEQNEAHWSNAEYDALVHKAAAIEDDATRFALYQKAEAILERELPVIPTHYYAKSGLLGSWVKGLYPNAMDLHPLRSIELRE